MSCDIMLADRDSYDNIVDELSTFVQFVRRDADVKAGDPVPYRLREGIAMHGAVLYPEPQIDRSLFTTTEVILFPDNSVGIGFNLDFIPRTYVMLIFRFKASSIHASCVGYTSVVESICSITAGPIMRLPGFSWERSYTGVGIGVSSSK